MKNSGLSRSYSRATLLYYCPKKYYFNYYTKYFKTFDRDFYKECLILKNLESVNMWLGTITHGILSDYLNLVLQNKASKENIEKLKKDTLSEMDFFYNKSKNKDFNEYNKEYKFGFSEHFYGENIHDKFIEGKNKVLQNFDRFLNHELHFEIISYFSKKNKIFIEPKNPDFESMKYYIENIIELSGITLRAQPDLGIIINDENKKTRYIIYDWKTGKVPEKPIDKISDQLKTYAYKMLLKLNLKKLNNIEIFCYEVFLQNMKIFGGKINDNDITDIESRIIKDVVEQKKLLVNQNTIKNQPLSIEYFKRTEQKNKCKYCRYRKVCSELENYEKKIDKLF